MTYKDFPVYIGYGNTDFISDWGYYRKYMLFANNVSITHSSSATPNRKIGRNVDQDNQFTYGSDSVSTINIGFNFYSKPRNNNEGENVYSFLLEGSEYQGNIIGNATGKNFFPIRVGGNVYRKCYIDSYTVNVSAYSPVDASVIFKCYEPPESEQGIKKDKAVNFDDYSDTMSGRSLITSNTCELEGLYNNIVSADVIPSISYTRKYSRTPVYTLGNAKPSDFLIDAVESQMKIESTGITNFSNYSGIKLESTIKLDVKDLDGQRILPDYFGGFEMACNSGARINNYDHSIQGGDAVRASVTISDVVL